MKDTPFFNTLVETERGRHAYLNDPRFHAIADGVRALELEGLPVAPYIRDAVLCITELVEQQIRAEVQRMAMEVLHMRIL